MTSDGVAIVAALAGWSFIPGSSPKRFLRQLHAYDGAKPLSERQTAWLFAIASSWRRQLCPGRIYCGSSKGTVTVVGLVDLVRFELTTSSMPFKKYQSLADSLAQNKRLSTRRRGLRWTPRGGFGGVWTPPGLQDATHGLARGFLRARLRAALFVVFRRRQQSLSL